MNIRTAFVTGGSRGIGAAIVRALAPCCNVAFTYRSSEAEARALESELAHFGGVQAFFCDVADPASVREAESAVRARFGGADALVNCAGVSLRGLLQDTSDEEWRRVFSVNCDGAFYVTRAFLPYMIEKKRGSIVNVSSVWGVKGAANESVYSASKAALVGLTLALAKELAPSGITVNAVAPGAVDTDMMKCYSPAELDELASSIPLGRVGKPEEIASAVTFLLQSDYVTGQVLTVDGGFTL